MENDFSKDMADVVRIHNPSIERNIGKSKLMKMLECVPSEVTIDNITVSITKKYVEFNINMEMGGVTELLTLKSFKDSEEVIAHYLYQRNLLCRTTSNAGVNHVRNRICNDYVRNNSRIQ